LPDEALRGGLDHLQAAEFLYEGGRPPNLEYTFRHALTHEVTYGSLLRDSRREIHARIVAVTETLHRDRLGEHTERLAYHAVRGELGQLAVHYLRQAAVKATAGSALQHARDRFDQALSLLGTLPESQSTLEEGFEIRLEQREVLTALGELPRTLERLREAEALAERLNDDRRRGRVWAVLTTAHLMLGEVDEALVSGYRALEIAGRLEDLRLRILTTMFLEQAHFFRGDYQRTVDLATDNLAMSHREFLGNSAPSSAYDRGWLSASLAQLGRITLAAEVGAEPIRLAEARQHPFFMHEAYLLASIVQTIKGDWANSLLLLKKGFKAIKCRFDDFHLRRSPRIAVSAAR
jgi:tetratricopeptide (TPR) repeat protein